MTKEQADALLDYIALEPAQSYAGKSVPAHGSAVEVWWGGEWVPATATTFRARDNSVTAHVIDRQGEDVVVRFKRWRVAQNVGFSDGREQPSATQKPL